MLGTYVVVAHGGRAQYATLLQNLQSAVIERTAALGDSDLTGVGISSADLLGISAAAIGTHLSGHLINEIKRRASRGGRSGRWLPRSTSMRTTSEVGALKIS